MELLGLMITLCLNNRLRNAADRIVSLPSPPNSYAEVLTPNVTVFREGAFGIELDLDEAMRVEPSCWDLVSL